MGAKPRNTNYLWNFGQIVGPTFVSFWPWGGRNRVDAAEISRNQSSFCQQKPSGPET